MAIIYRQGTNEDTGLAAPTVVIDDSSDWWAGAQKCFASIALAAVLSTTALASQIGRQICQDQGDFTGTLSAYTSSPPQAFQLRLSGGGYSVRYAPDTDEFAAPVTAGQDEDYWQPVRPIPASLYQRLPYLPDVEGIPAGSLFGQYDEDFWRSGVSPAWWTNLCPQQFSFDVQEPAGSLYGQADEDCWQNPVRPVQPSMRFALPLGDQDDVYPTTPATLATDEDFWQNKVAPVQASLFRSPAFRDADEIPAGFLYGQADEDCWENPVRPVQASFYQQLPYLFDAGDFARPNLVSEDFWSNPAIPVAANVYQRLPYLFDPVEIASTQSGTALPAGLSLVAAENDPTASAQVSQPGGSRPARRRARGAFPSVPPPIPHTLSAIVRVQGLSLQANHGRLSASGSANAHAKVPSLEVAVGNPTAKGIRNPTDEELIAILMGA